MPTSRRVSHLYVIPGRPPDLTLRPPGCPFAPRCAQVIERCQTEHPALEPAETPGHVFRCWNPQELEA
jgi:oligopeptide/dipeptide ABC transporter ATP-binding protein